VIVMRLRYSQIELLMFIYSVGVMSVQFFKDHGYSVQSAKTLEKLGLLNFTPDRVTLGLSDRGMAFCRALHHAIENSRVAEPYNRQYIVQLASRIAV